MFFFTKKHKITRYNCKNVKLPNMQLQKLKLGIKNVTEVPLNPSSNMTIVNFKVVFCKTFW